MVIDVGTVFPFEKLRLFVRVICSPPVAPVGTVINTGDQTAAVVAAGLRDLQVADELATTAPQL
jgi:hypothetical protein